MNRKFSGLFAGLTTIDIQYFVDLFPESNKKIKTEIPPVLAGGPATNAANAFAFLNGGASLASPTGKNSFSDFIDTDFQSNNINYFNLNGSQHYNPVLAAVITSRLNGDRNIFTNHPDPIEPEIRAEELFQKVNPQIVLSDVFYPEAVVEICHVANRLNIPVVLDCGSWKSQYEQIIPYTQIAICSADFIPPGCETIDYVVDFLHEHGIQKSNQQRRRKFNFP